MRIRRKAIVFLIVAAVFMGLFCRYLGRAPKRNYCDFRVYYATGARFAEKEDIYARPDESITPFKYSPMFAMLMWPLSCFTQKTASLIFFTLNFILLVTIFIFSEKLIVEKKISFKNRVLLYIATIGCTLRFMLHTLDSGQANIIVLALILLGLYFLRKKKDAVSGAFISLSIMFKYTPAIFLPYFILRKKGKLVLFITAFLILYCLIPALHVGIDKEADYIKSWVPFISGTSFDRGSMYDNKNFSLFSLSLRYFTAGSPYRSHLGNLGLSEGIALASIAGLIIYVLSIFPKGKKVFDMVNEYSLLLICMTILNPNAWPHNFVVFIFVYMALFYYLINVKFRDRITLIAVIISFVLMTLTSETFVGERLEMLSEEFSLVTIGALVLLFTLFRLKFKVTEKIS